MIIVLLAAGLLLWLLLPKLRSAAGRSLGPSAARTAAIVVVVLAIAVAARGNPWAALCLFGASLWMLGRASRGTAGPTRARASPIVAADRGGIRILAGPERGRRLDALGLAACLGVRDACAAGDPAGLALLEAYLDRRFPGWRPAGHGDADAGRRRARFANEMTEEQAYQVLGLGRGATRAEIIRSHREAMKRWHPDHGGTVDAAARANEAKEVLLRRHD